MSAGVSTFWYCAFALRAPGIAPVIEACSSSRIAFASPVATPRLASIARSVCGSE